MSILESLRGIEITVTGGVAIFFIMMSGVGLYECISETFKGFKNLIKTILKG